MKTYVRVPTEIKKRYGISRKNGRMYIGSPAYISICEPYTITNSKHTVDIRNKNVVVMLWRDYKYMHVTLLNEHRTG